MFLSMILILSCMIILYIVEGSFFCRYCLQAFREEEILKPRINDCFKINGRQMIQIFKEGEYVKFKIYEGKIKSPFMIYADFESVWSQKSKTQMNLILTNIKNMMLAVMLIS